ncbi:hypothetical protein H4R33_002335 [Dimargaris cristalligena]|nr:hypothetical protein H4R33_002335 [Dimargaris cristalligena]
MLAVFTGRFYDIWRHVAESIPFEQLMASVSAVLATTGELAKLRELWDAVVRAPQLSSRSAAYMAMLLLEFDNSDPAQVLEMAGQINIDCEYAGIMGFENAKTKCLSVSQIRPKYHNALSQMTGRGLVYVRRDYHGNPELAIRARRSAVRALFGVKENEPDAFPWLDTPAVDEQLYMVKYREHLPPPRTPGQQ